MNSHEKLDVLKKNIGTLGNVLVAFSGGVDSTFLLHTCVEVLGKDNVLAVTAISPTYQKEEAEWAKKCVASIQVRHILIHTHEMENREFAENTRERCYLCKRELFSRLRALAEKYSIPHVLEGSNMDDEGDFRPGMRAARELDIISPLRDAGLTKEDIRTLSKEMGLSTHDKPSQACLASRFPYGERITEEKLAMVAEAEAFLRKLGFTTVRVRHHGALARVEVGREYMGKMLDEHMRAMVVDELKRIGYTWICLDLAGYRSGSMNEVLDDHEAV